MKWYLFTLFLFASALVRGQKFDKAQFDSLVQEVAKAKPDTGKVKLLMELAAVPQEDGFEQCLVYCQEALALSEQLMYDAGRTTACSRIAAIYHAKADFAKALDYNFKALKLTEASGDKKRQASILTEIGKVYTVQGRDSIALKCYAQALDICRATKEREREAVTLMLIGNVYRGKKIGHLQTSLNYYNAALQIAENEHIAGFATVLMGSMAFVYKELRQYSRALDYAFKIHRAFEASNDKYNSAISYGLIGEVYMDIAGDTSFGSSDSLVPATRAAQLTRAIAYLEQGLAACSRMGLLSEATEIGLQVAEAYAMAGDYSRAYEYQRRYSAMNDSLFSIQSKEKLAKLETDRAVLVKEKQIEADKRKSKERLFFVIGTVLMLAIIGIVVRSYYLQRKANRVKETLIQQKEVLLGQKDVLMKEIHHRVKNNLQVISTLLDLQLENINDDNARKAITEGMTRVKSISLIHQQLYLNEDITTIEFSKFAGDLVDQVTSVFRKRGQEISFVKQVPQTWLDIDTAVPLGLILNELITNSYKYAFDSSAGFIKLVLEKKDGSYTLTYTDSGTGLPAGYDMSKSTGLGMMVIQSLGKQLGGEFVYDFAAKNFVLTFKDIEGRKQVP